MKTKLRYKDINFGGDMRDITVSFKKVHQQMGTIPKLTMDGGVREVLHALRNGVRYNPHDAKYRNAQFTIQR